MNLLPARAVEGDVIAPALGPDVIPCRAPGHVADLVVGFRPQDIRIVPGQTHTVDMTEALGGVSYVHCAHAQEQKLIIETTGTHVERPGAGIAVKVDPATMFMFDGNTGHRLR